MIIGIAQINIIWENSSENMKKIQEFIKEAAKEKVQLILFPEMSLTGFTMNIQELSFSEEEIISWIKTLSKKYKINIGLGFGIKENEKGANKYVIISNEGEVLADYKKIHPFSHGGEDKKYNRGNEIYICKVNEFKISPFICYDLRFPEIFQLASKEAKVITVAANWPKEREEHWITLLKARAIENQCYIIGINRIGSGNQLQYNGASIFVSPNGVVLNEITSEEKLIIQELKLETVIEQRSKFNTRKDKYLGQLKIKDEK